MLPLCHLPVLELTKHRLLAVAHVELRQGLIRPVNRNLRSTCLIALVNNHLDEFGLVKLRIDNNLLALLHVNTASRYQVCVFFKSCLVHFIL